MGVNEREPISPEFLKLRPGGLDAQGRRLSQTKGSAQGAESTKDFPAPFRADVKQRCGEVGVDLGDREWHRDASFDRPFGRVSRYIRGRSPRK